MYEYKAKCIKVVDGDTVDLEVDMGFYIHSSLRFRLLGIDAPEIRGPNKVAGQKSKQYLLDQLSNVLLRIETEKADSFGRWLCSIYLPDGKCINDEMIRKGLAKVYTK